MSNKPRQDRATLLAKQFQCVSKDLRTMPAGFGFGFAGWLADLAGMCHFHFLASLGPWNPGCEQTLDLRMRRLAEVLACKLQQQDYNSPACWPKFIAAG